MSALSLYAAMGAALKTPNDNNKVASESLSEIGATLREVRRNFKLETASVAKDLMIAEKHIIALEKGDWSALPAEVYAKGYLRKYANYLRLDSAKILDKLQPATVKLELIQTPIISKTQSDAELKLLLGLLAAVMIALIIVLFYKPSQQIDQSLIKPIPQNLVHYMQAHEESAMRKIPDCLRVRATDKLWQCYLPMRLRGVEKLHDLQQTLHIKP
jgi:DNA-binding XRE family transcriptional regulator